MPCTTLLVGKKASYDGSTLMARNEDSGSGHFCAKKFIVVNPKDQVKVYKSVISKVVIELPDNPLRYTAMPNAINDEGIWGEAGINSANVSMSETETITSNPRVLGADPLVKTGIGEEDMLTIVLPYIKSAREGVKRLGSLLEKYGTYEMNGIGFQDVNEIWWLESIGGHHWIAKRVPDDAYVVMPNQQGIDYLDLKDAFSKQESNMCSSDLISFIRDNHLDLAQGDVKLEENENFNVRYAFGSHSDSDHSYNTPRAWYMLRYFNKNSYKFEGEDAYFSPEDDNLPWSMVPDAKITIEDMKYVLSSYYQGTKYNPYSNKGDDRYKGMYRAIGINRNNFLAITQLRPYMDKNIMALEWIAEGSNAFNELVPFYANVTKTPAYLSKTNATVTTESFYWVNRIIGALVDAHYSKTIAAIDGYRLSLASSSHNLIKKFDQEFKNVKEKDVNEYLEKCNQELAANAKKLTDKVLDKVLFEASLEMKNGFSRSDA